MSSLHGKAEPGPGCRRTWWFTRLFLPRWSLCRSCCDKPAGTFQIRGVVWMSCPFTGFQIRPLLLLYFLRISLIPLEHRGVSKSRFTTVSTRNTEFILALLVIIALFVSQLMKKRTYFCPPLDIVWLEASPLLQHSFSITMHFLPLFPSLVHVSFWNCCIMPLVFLFLLTQPNVPPRTRARTSGCSWTRA